MSISSSSPATSASTGWRLPPQVPTNRSTSSPSPHVIYVGCDRLILGVKFNGINPLAHPDDRVGTDRHFKRHGLRRVKNTRGGRFFAMYEDQFMTLQLKERFGVFHASAKIKTRPLHLKPRRACARARRILRTLPWHGACPVEPYLVDIDLFADIVGLANLNRVVEARDDRTRMRILVTNLIPSGQGELAGGGSFRWGADGRIRLYDKIAELKVAPGKAAWMRSIYVDRGWNGSDPIVRLEIRPSKRLLRTALLAGQGWDLGHLWRETLKPLGFISPTQGTCPRQCPSMRWWDQVMSLTIRPPWSVAPASMAVAHIGLTRRARVALGQARGALATMLALSCLACGALGHLSAREVQDVAQAGLTIDSAFADAVAAKAVALGVDRPEVRSSHLPSWFRDAVLDAM